MSTVRVRDARREDARAIAAIWAVVTPHRVRSAARAAATVRREAPSGRRTYVADVGGRVVGTASARPIDKAAPHAASRTGQTSLRDVLLTVEVLPDHGSRGVGTALLSSAVRAFDGVDYLRAVGADDPVTMAFAVRNGFLPDGQHRLSVVHTGAAATAGPVPSGLRPCALDTLGDLALLAEAHGAAFAGDPTGLVAPASVAALSAWWEGPDAAPELSFGLLDERREPRRLVAFSLAEVDRERGAGWCGQTATVPDERGRGLGGWVRRRTVTALHQAGVAQAWTEVDDENAAMLAIDERIGFRSSGTTVRLARRVPR